jgi:uncharacterized membrane protein YgcG
MLEFANENAVSGYLRYTNHLGEALVTFVLCTRHTARWAIVVFLTLSGACARAAHPAVDMAPRSEAVELPSPVRLAVDVSIPHRSGHINDYAGLLTSKQRAELEARLAEYEAETTHQIAVLTVQSLQGESIESFSMRVANAWKLGRKGLDNGVLVTVALKDRKIRIELGSGLSQFVSDSIAAKIIDNSMTPEFRAGQYGRGIERGVERLMAECRAYKMNL